MKKNFKGFTLAETMIVLAIMGVIASLTLPALLRRQTEQANRTRIRKAMKAYDTAIQKMVIENNIKTDGAFTNWAEDDCSNTVSYFKISENGDNGCTFKTSDGVWWDISDIKKPIVAVRSEKLTDEVARDENDNDAFYFITTFDPNARAFRTDDYAFETGDNKVALKKLYNFVKPEVGNANAMLNGVCSCESEGCCASNCQGEVCIEPSSQPCRTASSSTVYGGWQDYGSKNCVASYNVIDNVNGGQHTLFLYDGGAAFTFGGFNYLVDTEGNLTMGVNMGYPHINDMKWDKTGKLIMAQQNGGFGSCTNSACTGQPSPFDAPECQNGNACMWNESEKKWEVGHQSVSTLHDTAIAVYKQIWDNYQKAQGLK